MSSEDIKTLGIIAAFVLSASALILTFVRTRDVKPLAAFVETKIADVELTTELEQKFARLPLARQEAIQKLIDIADPFTNLWPGDLDNRVAAWLKEIVDATPLKDKPTDPALRG